MEDRRHHVRYPYGASTLLRWEGQREPAAVQVVDISAVSVTLEITGPLENPPEVLALELDGGDSPFPLALIRTERTWYGTVVHASFDRLSATHEAHLSRLLETLSNEQAATLDLMLRGRLLG